MISDRVPFFCRSRIHTSGSCGTPANDEISLNCIVVYVCLYSHISNSNAPTTTAAQVAPTALPKAKTYITSAQKRASDSLYEAETITVCAVR